MPPAIYEIYEAETRMGKAGYPRPCVVLTINRDGKLSALGLSSAMDLYRGLPFHFRVDVADPDFKSTGLSKDSYINGEVTLTLDACNLLYKRGELRGELLKRFKNWIV